jgi:hypothetical protein
MQIKLNYLSILLGLFYCLWILWNRLFRSQEPINLFTEYTTRRVIVYSLLFIGSILLVLFFIRKLFNLTSKMLLLKSLLNKPKLISLLSFVQNDILNAPKNLYEWVYERVHIRDRMTPIGQFIYYQNFNEKPYKMKFIIGFLYSFQILICLTFFHNVFLLNKLTYFYKILILLLIPMLLRILIFIQYNLSAKLKKNIETFIKFVPKESNDGWVMYRTDAYKDNPNLTKAKMDYYASCWYMYIHSLMSIDHLYHLEKKIKPYVYIICYSLYTVGWGYILYRIYLNEYGSLPMLPVNAFEWLWIIQDIEEPFSLTMLTKLWS